MNNTNKNISVKGLSNEDFVNSALSNTSAKMHGNEGLFILINIMIRGIGGKYTIKNAKVYDARSGEDLSEQEAVKNPPVQVLPTASLSFQNKARDQVSALFRKYGFDLGKNTFLLKQEKALSVYKELLIIQATLAKDTDEFYEEYPRIIEEQKFFNPKLKDIIEQYVPKREKIKQQIYMKISPPQALAIHSGAMSEVEHLLHQSGNTDISMSGGLLDQMISGFCKDVEHFWNYNLRQIRNAVNSAESKARFEDPNFKRAGVSGVAIEILKNLKSKVEEIQLLQPAFSEVGKKLDWAVSLLPDGYNTQVKSIKDFQAMKRCLEVITDLKSKEVVKNLVTNHHESSDIYDLLEVEIAENKMLETHTNNNDKYDNQVSGTLVETSMDALFNGVFTEDVEIEANNSNLDNLDLTDTFVVNQLLTHDEQLANQEEDLENFADAFAEALSVSLSEEEVPASIDLQDDEKAYLESEPDFGDDESILAQTSVSNYAREAEIIDEQPARDESKASNDAHKEPEQTSTSISTFGVKEINVNDIFNGLF